MDAQHDSLLDPFKGCVASAAEPSQFLSMNTFGPFNLEVLLHVCDALVQVILSLIVLSKPIVNFYNEPDRHKIFDDVGCLILGRYD